MSKSTKNSADNPTDQSMKMKNSAENLKEQILYAPEYREILPGLFKKFNPVHQTKNFLRDLVLTQHTLLKLIDGSSSIIVRGYNSKKSKKVKKSKKIRERIIPFSKEEEKDGAWNDIQEDLDAAVEAEFDLDNIMRLNILNPMEDVIVALGHIQLAIHGKKHVTGYSPGLLGVHLLRASQQLWPDDEKLGNRDNERETLETLCKGALPQRFDLNKNNFHQFNNSEHFPKMRKIWNQTIPTLVTKKKKKASTTKKLPKCLSLSRKLYHFMQRPMYSQNVVYCLESTNSTPRK